jgi:hypothetical protein
MCRPVVRKCGAHGRWSMTKVKVMRVRADVPRVAKDEHWELIEGPEKPGDLPWWLTPGTRTDERTW